MAALGFGQDLDSLVNVFENAHRSGRLDAAMPIFYLLKDDGTISKNTEEWSDVDHVPVQVYNAVSLYYYNEGDYDKSLEYAEKGLPLIPEDSIAERHSFLSIISVLSVYFEDYERAIEAAEQRLTITDDDVTRASICNTLSAAYGSFAISTSDVSDNANRSLYLTKALEFSQEAVTLRRQYGNDEKGLLAAFLGKQSEILSNMDRPEEALAVIEEAIALDLEAGRMNRYYSRLVQKGHVLLQQDRYEEAREAYLESIEHIDPQYSPVTYNTLLYQLGMVELGLGNKRAAISYFEECQKKGQEMGSDKGLKVYQELAKCYSTLDPRKAYDLQVQYSIAYDSLMNEKLLTQLNDFQVRYETAEKERQLVEQQAVIEHRGMLIRMWAIIALVMIVGLIAIAWLAARYRKQGKELERLNQTRSRLFSIITHDLKTPVVAQNQVLHAINKNLDAMPAEELKEQCELLCDTSDALKDQLLNLVQWARTETGKVTIEPVNFCIADEVQTCLRQLKVSIAEKHIVVEQNVPEDLVVNSDRNVVAVVLGNLVSNAIKFSQVGGTIAINLVEDGNRYWLSVKDSGVGISPAKLQQLFQFTVRSSAGTSGEMGTGLGLYVSKLMLDKVGSEIKVESVEGQGSTFRFTVNKNK